MESEARTGQITGLVRRNALIIGSTGRNTGKTEFACRVIGHLTPGNDIYGVKVIPVDKNGDKCHRGAEGCGLCDSLSGDYEIMEEHSTGTPKDTSRMLKAGARRVFLLLVNRMCLAKGIQAMFNELPAEGLILIESNSVRTVLRPGLFLIIRKLPETSVKPTCAGVMDLADRIIEFEHRRWSVQPERVSWQNQRWMLTG